MSRQLVRLFLVIACVALLPFHAPAPLVYTPGEGWSYEAVGGQGKWRRMRAKDQLDVAQEAFDTKKYSIAIKASRHLVKTWPLSDYAPQAQYLLGRCYEAKGQDERAFNAYQGVVENYPQSKHLDEVLKRQYAIAGRFLGGEWFRLWNYIPYPQFFDRERVPSLYEKIVKNAPFSEIAPQAQMKIGESREKQRHYPEAVKAFERAADRYSDQPRIAADALYRVGMAYRKQSKTAEYDHGASSQAIDSLTDFITLYPDDPRVPEAQKTIEDLKGEEAQGNFDIAEFYQKRGGWKGALIYYNEVLSDPSSPLASVARQRIEKIKQRIQTASK